MTLDTDQFSDLEIIAKTIYGEIRSGDFEGRAGVAAVIMNRMAHPAWWGGPDPRSVCLKPFQFSCWLHSDPNRQAMLNVPMNDPNYLACIALANQVITGTLTDPTGGANSYFAASMETAPAWAENLTPLCELGGQLFFKI